MTITSAPSLDVICIGRAAVDLYGDQLGGRLEDMQSFSKYLGGSPANTAYGCARLGLRAAMLTRVGDEHNGRFVRETLASAGVDVSHVTTDPSRMTALAFLGIRDRETFPLVFYRDNCADMALGVEDIDESFIGSARSLLISGTHLSRPNTYAACAAAMKAARRLGVKVVLDIDYRPVLWGLATLGEGEQRFVADAAVSAKLQTIVGLCDLIVGTEEEVVIAGGTEDVLSSIKVLRDQSEAVLVLKRGAAGCTVFDGAIPAQLDAGVSGAGFAVEVFNVLGAGDAFMAGFLRGWLRGEPHERCCELANACGAIAVSRHGCAPAMPTWAELSWFLAAVRQGFSSPRLRANAEFEHVHRATTREARWGQLAVFAIDHRAQLEEMADQAGAPYTQITRFKALAVRAAIETPTQGTLQKGLLLDDRYGEDLLSGLTDTGLWIGRAVERPGSMPLRWDVGAELASAIRT